MSQNEKLVKQRDLFRKLADGIDEMIKLDEREAAGEDAQALEKELESILGRYMMLLMELEKLK